MQLDRLFCVLFRYKCPTIHVSIWLIWPCHFQILTNAPKRLFSRKFLWRWHDDRTLILSLLQELLYAVTKFQTMANLMKTPGHVAKIIHERVFLLLSHPFEGMDILSGLMENLLEPWCHNGCKDVIYGVPDHKTFVSPKHIGKERAGWFTLIALMMYCDC